MTFDESKVDRDRAGKFSDKVGTAAEVSLAPAAKRRKVNVPKWAFISSRLEAANVETGTVAEDMGVYGRRYPVYMDGELQGHVHGVQTRPHTNYKGTRIRKDLAERTEWLFVTNEGQDIHHRGTHRWDSRATAIFEGLDKEIKEGRI